MKFLKTEANMKKYLPLLLLAAIFLFQISPVEAWSVTNHHAIAEKTYYALPQEVQDNLDLDEMKNGSDDPDLTFFDFEYHSYPASKIKAKFWLNEGKINYEKGDYNYASYCFGVASHYISDGFCGPHSVNNASKYYHSLYEIRAMFLTPHIEEEYQGDLSSIMEEGNLEVQDSWNKWRDEGDDAYIQEDLDRATSATYRAIKNSLN